MGILLYMVQGMRAGRVAGAAGAALLVALAVSCSKGEREPDAAARRDDLLEKFRSVPYTVVTDEEVGTAAGVTVHIPDKAWRGYNLHCLRTEGQAVLMDMDGNEVHRWTQEAAIERGWPYGVILGNGDFITYREDFGLIRLDWNSNILWRVAMGVHHEIWPLPDGSFYALVRRTRKHRGLTIRISDITLFSGEGQVLEAWSAYDNLEHIKRALDTRSFFDTVLDSLEASGTRIADLDTLPPAVHRAKTGGRTMYDYFHMNTVSVLPDTRLGREDPRFRAGNLLTCFRNVNQIAVLDRDSMEIVWAWGEGRLEWPHHPTMLDNGNILIFDNGVVRQFSRVIELNPVTERVEWEYVGDPPETFYSRTRGSAQRLPNGNTLICEGDRGRCLEVTREGEVVWEWLNPMTQDGHRVQVYRMMRYPHEMIERLLGAGT
jgi:hypothetical protein